MKELLPKTRRMVIFFLGVVVIIASWGWAFGDVDIKDAMLIVGPAMTGFFTLLKGEQ